jgi:hypothetical protein
MRTHQGGSWLDHQEPAVRRDIIRTIDDMRDREEFGGWVEFESLCAALCSNGHQPVELKIEKLLAITRPDWLTSTIPRYEHRSTSTG